MTFSSEKSDSRKQPTLGRLKAIAKKLHFTKLNAISGIFIYALGDTVAALITGEVSLGRIVGMAVLGGTLYAIEIPNWFLLVDRMTAKREKNRRTALLRMFYAIVYFNPLWIARHLLFVNLFSGQWSDITWNLASIGLHSFIFNIPIALIGNYIIQNKMAFKWRYIGNCVFSALMAIYFAMSEIWFG